MYALYKQHFAFAKLQALAIVFAFACGKVKFRNLNSLSAEQFEQIALHCFAIHSLYVIEVVLAVGQLRSILAIDEIIVGGERNRAQSTSLKLHRKSLAECGFSRTRRTCNQHHSHWALFVIITAIDFFSYLHYLLFLQSFANLNQLACHTLLARFIHSANVLQTHDHIPAHIFGKDAECAWHIHLFSQAIGVFPIGNAQ